MPTLCVSVAHGRTMARTRHKSYSKPQIRPEQVLPISFASANNGGSSQPGSESIHLATLDMILDACRMENLPGCGIFFSRSAGSQYDVDKV